MGLAKVSCDSLKNGCILFFLQLKKLFWKTVFEKIKTSLHTPKGAMSLYCQWHNRRGGLKLSKKGPHIIWMAPNRENARLKKS